MALPISITVTGTLLTVNGTPKKGHVIFKSPVRVLSSSSNSVVIPSYKSVALAADGTFSISIPASNDPAWTPVGWTYEVIEQFKNEEPRSFETVIPYNAAGGTINYSSLVPALGGGSELYAAYSHTHAGGGSGAVTSVFSRTGAVVAQSGDYTKAQVGLGNVDNTSDLNKPVSTATQTALNGKENTGVAATLVASHEADTTNVHGIADTSALATNASVASAIAGIDFPVDSVAGKTGTVTLVKGDVGLSNVDNTSDANKPVSTATQTALDLKAPLASPTFTGTVSGITKSMVGLGNVDNTADSAKTFTRSQISDIGAKVIVLNVGDPVPGGTPSGTVIVRV